MPTVSEDEIFLTAHQRRLFTVLDNQVGKSSYVRRNIVNFLKDMHDDEVVANAIRARAQELRSIKIRDIQTAAIKLAENIRDLEAKRAGKEAASASVESNSKKREARPCRTAKIYNQAVRPRGSKKLAVHSVKAPRETIPDVLEHWAHLAFENMSYQYHPDDLPDFEGVRSYLFERAGGKLGGHPAKDIQGLQSKFRKDARMQENKGTVLGGMAQALFSIDMQALDDFMHRDDSVRNTAAQLAMSA